MPPISLKDLADSVSSVEVTIGSRTLKAYPLTARQDLLIRDECPESTVSPKEREYKKDADAKNAARVACMAGTMLRIATGSFPDGPPADDDPAKFQKYLAEIKGALQKILSLTQMNQVLLAVHEYEVTGRARGQSADPVETAVGN